MICDRNGSGVHKVASFINFQLFLYLYQTPFFMVTGLHKPVARKGPPNCLGLGGFKDFSWDFFTNELEEIKIFFFDLVFPLGAPRPDHGLLGHLPGLKQNPRHGCSHAHTLGDMNHKFQRVQPQHLTTVRVRVQKILCFRFPESFQY